MLRFFKYSTCHKFCLWELHQPGSHVFCYDLVSLGQSLRFVVRDAPGPHDAVFPPSWKAAILKGAEINLVENGIYRLQYLLLMCSLLATWHCFSSVLHFLSLFMYFERERETQSIWVGEGQREGGRESQAGYMLPAQSTMWVSNAWTVRSWPEPRSRAGHLTDRATQAPCF